MATYRRLGINYDICSVDELRGFIKSRTGKEAKPDDDLTHYVQVLEELDRTATFRFEDLPPELRNAVYSEHLFAEQYELSTGNNGPGAILRTSKQINKEAEHVLYSEDVLRIFIFSSSNRQYFSLQSSINPSFEIYDRDGGNIIRGMPSTTINFRHVGLYAHADLDGRGIHGAWYGIRIRLYAVTSVLLTGCAKTVDFSLTTQGTEPSPEPMHQALEPLKDLGPRIALGVEGLPETIKERLMRAHACHPEGGNGISQLLLFKKDVLELAHLMKQVGLRESSVVTAAHSTKAMVQNIQCFYDWDHTHTGAVTRLKSKLPLDMWTLKNRALAKLNGDKVTGL